MYGLNLDMSSPTSEQAFIGICSYSQAWRGPKEAACQSQGPAEVEGRDLCGTQRDRAVPQLCQSFTQ